MLSPFRRKDEQYPEYRALRAYGSLFRVLGVVAAILAVLVLVLGILGAVFSRDDRLAATANAAQTLIFFSGFALTAFMLFVPADVIFAYVDLVKDARRQRIATERSNALLAELLTVQAAMLEGK
jgi:flagellar motor component MotA